MGAIPPAFLPAPCVRAKELRPLATELRTSVMTLLQSSSQPLAVISMCVAVKMDRDYTAAKLKKGKRSWKRVALTLQGSVLTMVTGSGLKAKLTHGPHFLTGRSVLEDHKSRGAVLRVYARSGPPYSLKQILTLTPQSNHCSRNFDPPLYSPPMHSTPRVDVLQPPPL